MRHFVLLLFVFLVAGCSSNGLSESDLSAIAKEGNLTFEGESAPFKVSTMNVFLVEDDSSPETFDIEGSKVRLAGTFPSGVKIGYEENFESILNKAIKIESKVNAGGEEVESYLEIGGARHTVTSGELTLTKVLGPSPDGAGKIVEGTLSLSTTGPSGAKSVKGKFQILAKSWG